MTPPDALVVVDGKAYDHLAGSLAVPPGEHVVSVHKYGFAAQSNKIDVFPGQNPKLDIRLQLLNDAVEATGVVSKLAPQTAGLRSL